MIKLHRHNSGVGGYYYTWEGNTFPRGLYLCEEKSYEIFGKQPDEIKVYGKNPKQKGQIKVVVEGEERACVNGTSVYIDYLIPPFIKQEFDSDTCWVTIK